MNKPLAYLLAVWLLVFSLLFVGLIRQALFSPLPASREVVK